METQTHTHTRIFSGKQRAVNIERNLIDDYNCGQNRNNIYTTRDAASQILNFPTSHSIYSRRVQNNNTMKMHPQAPLSLNPPLHLWNDMIWRGMPTQQSQLENLKTQLPQQLATDPRAWSRDDVRTFLRYCVQEFDLPELDLDQFAINGKGLCMLTSKDFNTRMPGAGDVVFNMLHLLLLESQPTSCILPQSPVTPTSRYAFPPHGHPVTPSWANSIALPESPFLQSTLSAIPHKFFPPTNSVTLSPPPSSIDSATSSPPQGQQQYPSQIMSITTTTAATSATVAGSAITSTSSSSNNLITNGGMNGNSNSNSIKSEGITLPDIALPSPTSIGIGGAFNMPATKTNGVSTGGDTGNQSDSDDECIDIKANIARLPLYGAGSPPTTPLLTDLKHNWHISSSIMRSGGAASGSPIGSGNSGSLSAPTTPSYTYKVKREFFPETAEPNTNGRLLWDFLQQLLNERHQKFKDLIAWKCSETGVFKIVDPPGLAKLWGIQKNHPSMNYDKMSRALRYYYRVNILRKVQGERHCYQFLRNPAELKGIKNISQLRQNPLPSSPTGTNGNCGSTLADRPEKSPSATSTQNNEATNWPIPPAANQQQQQAHEHQQLHQQQQAQLQHQYHQQQQQQERAIARDHRTHQLTLPVMAAAVAVANYAQPPSSPIFYQALNNYLSGNSAVGPPPGSPAAMGLLPTPRDKFEFNPLKVALTTSSNGNAIMHDPIMRNNGGSSSSNNSSTNNNSTCNSSNNNSNDSNDDKPTDLSVNSSNGERERERNRERHNHTTTPAATNATGDESYP